MNKLHRKKLRLTGFDYSSYGYYFVTICTHDRKRIFGNPENLTQCGKIAAEELENLHERIQGVSVDKYIIMPNHIHAVIIIGCENIGELTPEKYMNLPQFFSLEKIVQLYKAGVTRRIHREVDADIKVWQKSFYDVILDNDVKYTNAWYYIEYNPIEEKIKKAEYKIFGDY